MDQRPVRPPTTEAVAAGSPREIDACGIGFVADIRGRPSRAIVTAALEGLACVKHRGAVAADARTADGAGLLAPIPRAIFGDHGVAVLFVRDEDPRKAAEDAAAAEGISVVDWREVPTDDGVLGELAAAAKPRIVQAILDGDPDEVRAYRMRRRLEKAGVRGLYVASCSFLTVVYKGLAPGDRLADFYPDLADDRFEGAFAIFHQRFSTNTLPSWERAQPMRLLCHNGEINAIAGNQNRMAARAVLGTEAAGLGPEDLIRPVLDPEDSDSGRLDAAVELLTRGGRDIRHALAMLIPPAWENDRELDPEVRGFYRYHSALMEPWDGPAGVIFTDGRRVGAVLDRNGLRPLRWAVCEDGLVVCASEVGAVSLRGRGAIQRGRLGPGQMLCVDPDDGGLQHDTQIKEWLAHRAPYARWAAEGFQARSRGEPVEDIPPDVEERQILHGYTREELAMVLRPMATDAKEPTFSMGDDTPLPGFSRFPRPVHWYLKQRFAQVTNPAIDPLRERLVMSLRTLVGRRQPILTERPDAAHLLTFRSFFVYPDAVDALLDHPGGPAGVRLDATFEVSEGPDGLRAAVVRCCDEAERAVAGGAGIVVIDDANVGPDRAPVPSLLVTGAVHHRLIERSLRSHAGIVVIADDIRDVHHTATLLGYGADLICPRLALQTVAQMADDDQLDGITAGEAQARYQAATEAGVLKILSKMGICTVDSYRGAQIFEVIGLDDEVVEMCFRGTPSAVGGLGWRHLGDDVLARHAASELDAGGFYRVRTGGEYHAHGKDEVEALNAVALVAEPKRRTVRTAVREEGGSAAERIAKLRARAGQPAPGGGDGAPGDGDGDDRAARLARLKGRRGLPDRTAETAERQLADMTAAHLLQKAIAGDSWEAYERFVALVDGRPPTELHDLLEIVEAPEPIPLEEVEPASEIVRRFSTGAMSHGALSREAHETLARAMNLIGGKANCGEGGEDPARYHTRGMGRDDRNSRIKQVASGRFGVTPEYLAHADELQIKIAQGSKPGEGGQLPGHKVSEEIARLRHTQPGVALISPPPHHDIYSIEDLAQLIYDLKQVNAAEVSVKLVATHGVGTIAAGVVKALADVVQISGHNGGTGASPLSSIKHAGWPWELGLAETQRALVSNGLRDRARIRVDGGFLTGRQVIMAALMGADEYSFGTAAMIAEGCIMLRACHRDTCKPGIATQRPSLRANFRGTPEGVAAYFMFVAHEVRRYLSRLGARSLDEVIGRVELLRQRRTGDERVDSVDLTPLITPPDDPSVPRRFHSRVEIQNPRDDLGDQLLADAFRAIWEGDHIELTYEIRNRNRAFGAALSGALALEFGHRTPPGSAHVRLTGSAGQSFGAFLTHGVTLELEGEANDYVGKGMGGGRIVIRPPADDAGDPVLAGNTCLYGATGGELFIAGSVGERFAVRNSGAVAVVEGAGDHCCEYMTGGTVVVLGRVGENLGAGMTGGHAFVWAPNADAMLAQVNTDLVEAVRPDADAIVALRWLVEQHAELTESPRARQLLRRWDEAVDEFWHILPKDRVRRIESHLAGRVTSA